jgi:hypothetical protein
MNPFSPTSTIVLTSTGSSQTTTVPAGATSLIAYSAAPDVVYLQFASSVAVPGSTWASAKPVYVLQPGTTQTFAIPREGGVLAYIATTTGGSLVLSVGNGV